MTVYSGERILHGVGHANFSFQGHNFFRASLAVQNGLFIAGTDTEVGKTYIACGVLRALRKRGFRVGAYKPVASGGQLEDASSDPSLLAAAAGLPLSRDMLNKICPQYFSASLAPPVAAELEGAVVNEDLLKLGLTSWTKTAREWDVMIVEGAGGLLSPVSQSKTVLDVAVDVGLPVAIVAVNRLGVVNHTLLTLAALSRTPLSVAAVVLNDRPAASVGGQGTDASRGSNRRLLSQFTDVPIVESAEALCDIAFSPSDAPFPDAASF